MREPIEHLTAIATDPNARVHDLMTAGADGLWIGSGRAMPEVVDLADQALARATSGDALLRDLLASTTASTHRAFTGIHRVWANRDSYTDPDEMNADYYEGVRTAYTALEQALRYVTNSPSLSEDVFRNDPDTYTKDATLLNATVGIGLVSRGDDPDMLLIPSPPSHSPVYHATLQQNVYAILDGVPYPAAARHTNRLHRQGLAIFGVGAMIAKSLHMHVPERAADIKSLENKPRMVAATRLAADLMLAEISGKANANDTKTLDILGVGFNDHVRKIIMYTGASEASLPT